MKIKRFQIICLSAVLCVLLAAMLGGCGAKRTEPDVPDPAGPGTVSPVTETSEPLLVQTVVGELAFPGELRDGVRMEEVSTETQQQIRFYSEAAGEPVLLFELAFGGDEGIYAVGTAPDTSGQQIPIWLNVEKLERGAGWSDEETERMNLLQSCVNDLLEQIYELPGFEMSE